MSGAVATVAANEVEKVARAMRRTAMRARDKVVRGGASARAVAVPPPTTKLASAATNESWKEGFEQGRRTGEQQDQRREGQRVEAADAAPGDHRAERHRDDNRRTQGGYLRAGELRVGGDDGQGEDRGPSIARLAAPELREQAREQEAEQGVEQPRGEGEVQAADGKQVGDARGAEARLHLLIESAALAHDERAHQGRLLRGQARLDRGAHRLTQGEEPSAPAGPWCIDAGQLERVGQAAVGVDMVRRCTPPSVARTGIARSPRRGEARRGDQPVVRRERLAQGWDRDAYAPGGRDERAISTYALQGDRDGQTDRAATHHPVHPRDGRPHRSVEERRGDARARLGCEDADAEREQPDAEAPPAAQQHDEAADREHGPEVQPRAWRPLERARGEDAERIADRHDPNEAHRPVIERARAMLRAWR